MLGSNTLASTMAKLGKGFNDPDAGIHPQLPKPVILSRSKDGPPWAAVAVSVTETRSSFTFLGNGEAGFRDGNGNQAQLSEPTGLSAAGGKLYIADTNNHAIRVADLATGDLITLEISGM